MLDEYVDTAEAAKRLGVSSSFLNKARLTGAGPAYVKFGKSVRYRVSDIREWTVSRTRRSTSEAA